MAIFGSRRVPDDIENQWIDNSDMEETADKEDKSAGDSPVDRHVAVDDVKQLQVEGQRYMEAVSQFSQTFENELASVEERQRSLGSRRGSSMFDVDESLMYFINKKVKVSLSFSNLTYSIPLVKTSPFSKCCRASKGNDAPEKKVILDNISAEVPAGRLVAVMGPTGCGKTSLINALAGRLEAGGELEGEVLVNGKSRDKSYRALVAYVMQDDVLFPNLTVQETFEFAARMRLPKNISGEAKMKLVDSIINELGLSKARNTRIGNAIYRGVSGGERKRTNIGIELLSGASLIFLDEPTSGLDAFQAMNIMESLWTLSTNGRTIITTIHQPRSSIFKMFDLLLLLSEGKTMYYGSAKSAVEFFTRSCFECPVNFNPADFFLDVVSMDYRSKEAEDSSRKRIRLVSSYFDSIRHEYDSTIKRELRVSIDSCDDDCRNLKVVVFPNGPFTEFALLFRRAWKQQSRDILPIAITFIQTVVVGFILAAIYSDMGSSATPVQDELGILFFVCIFSAFGAMFQALNTFPTDRSVVNRERASKMYHVLPYYIARFICDIPTRVGQGLLFGCIVYWIVGLNPAASAFFIFCALLIVEGLAAQGFGVCISAVCPNEKVAFAIAPAITVVLILVGGFYVNQDAIPVWISWLKYISHLYWAYMGLTINDFAGRTGWETCLTITNGTCVATVPTTGDEVLARLGFNPGHLWLSFVVLIGLMLFYNFMGYVFLRLSKSKTMPVNAIKQKKSE
jgi:ABC-type multidrug transport system ATPase subunit/ABC-type multidrug transport system permease subunit